MKYPKSQKEPFRNSAYYEWGKYQQNNFVMAFILDQNYALTSVINDELDKRSWKKFFYGNTFNWTYLPTVYVLVL